MERCLFRLFAVVVAVVCGMGRVAVAATGDVDFEPVKWFGDPAQAVGLPYGLPAPGPGGTVYGMAYSAIGGRSQVIYRVNPSEGGLELVAHVPEVNAIEPDGQGGLYATAGQRLLAVSAAGVVREIHRFDGAPGTGLKPLYGGIGAPGGWVYGVTGEGPNGNRGVVYRVRPDGSGFEVRASLPDFPYGPADSRLAGLGRLRLDADGGVYGLLQMGARALGQGPNPPVELGVSGVFRLDASGQFTVLSLGQVEPLDVVRRPDGSFVVLLASMSWPVSHPYRLVRLPGAGGETEVLGVVGETTTTPGTLLPGMVLKGDGNVLVVARDGIRFLGQGNWSGGLVRFTPGIGVAQSTGSFSPDTDPWQAGAASGLVEIGGQIFGVCSGFRTSGSLYRVTDAGKVDVVRRFSIAGGARVATQGPLVMKDGKVLLPTQEAEASTSIRLHRFDPATRQWEDAYGTGPSGVPGIGLDRRPVIVTEGPNADLWLVEDGANGEESWSKVHRLTPGMGMQLVGLANRSTFSSYSAPGGLIRATDGLWYGTAQYGDSPISEGFVYRVHPVNTGVQVLMRFPDDSSRGRNPFGGVVEAESGWLYGMTHEGRNRATWPGVYRVRLNGTGFESLGTLTGFGTGGFVKARDGNLYTAVREGFGSAEGVLLRVRVATRKIEVVGRWAFARFGTINVTATPTEGPDGRLYMPAGQGDLNPRGVVVSMGLDGSDPRVDLELGVENGGRFVGALAVGPSGWFYGATVQGGPAGGGGLVRFRLRPTLSMVRGVEAPVIRGRAYPGARAWLQVATELGGPWQDGVSELALGPDGAFEVGLGGDAEARYFRVRIVD